MQLSGTFDPDDFVEILDLVARRHCSGRFAVRAGGLHGSVRLVDGDAAAAEASGSVLANSRTKWPVTLEYICFEALRSGFGTFDLQPDEGAPVLPGPRVALKDALDGGRRRLELWRQVEKVIHTVDAVPRLSESLPADITVDRDSWSVLVALDGRRSVAALAKRFNRDILELCQVLEPLVTGGAVLLDQPEAGSKSLPKVRLDRNLGEPFTGLDDLYVSVESPAGDADSDRPILSIPAISIPAISGPAISGPAISATQVNSVPASVDVDSLPESTPDDESEDRRRVGRRLSLRVRGHFPAPGVDAGSGY